MKYELLMILEKLDSIYILVLYCIFASGEKGRSICLKEISGILKERAERGPIYGRLQKLLGDGVIKEIGSKRIGPNWSPIYVIDQQYKGKVSELLLNRSDVYKGLQIQ